MSGPNKNLYTEQEDKHVGEMTC